jgi:hypothetical protein
MTVLLKKKEAGSKLGVVVLVSEFTSEMVLQPVLLLPAETGNLKSLLPVVLS